LFSSNFTWPNLWSHKPNQYHNSILGLTELFSIKNIFSFWSTKKSKQNKKISNFKIFYGHKWTSNLKMEKMGWKGTWLHKQEVGGPNGNLGTQLQQWMTNRRKQWDFGTKLKKDIEDWGEHIK
jgi:hypothetical protein